MVSTEFKGIGLHYTAFRDAIREDSRQTTPSRGITPRKKFAVEANVESRVNRRRLAEMPRADSRTRASRRDRPSPRWFRLLRCITPRGMTCHVLLTSARRRLRLPECAGRASTPARASLRDSLRSGDTSGAASEHCRQDRKRKSAADWNGNWSRQEVKRRHVLSGRRTKTLRGYWMAVAANNHDISYCL